MKKRITENCPNMGDYFTRYEKKNEQMVINNGRVGSWMKYLVLLI